MIAAGVVTGMREPRVHWPEALMEALGLGLFMVSAGLFGTLFEYPGSPIHQLVPSAFTRRALMGAAMALTAVALIHSPWGRRSGAHINPAVTLTFWRLGRVRGRDAAAYAVAQFAGGLAGALAVGALLGDAFVAPPVTAVATLPGTAGLAVAFLCEAAISFGLLLLVLTLGRSPRLAPHTAMFVGAALFLYITFEAPLSGMSMNPARTLASAVPAHAWHGWWIYFVAPVVGMVAASQVHVLQAGTRRAGCAKLVHSFPCIFCGGQPPPPNQR